MNNKADNKNFKEKRINFILSNQEYDLLKDVQFKTNLSISELVRDALKIYGWAQEEDTNEKELKELAKNAIKIYIWTQKQAEQNGIESSPTEFIRNSIKVFLWARKGMQKGGSQLDPKEIQILF